MTRHCAPPGHNHLAAGALTVTVFPYAGEFLCLLFLFVRFLPMISIFEMRALLPAAEVQGSEAREVS